MTNGNSVLQEGDMLLLVDQKDRRYLLTLKSKSEFHSHSGYISHDDLIGKKDGVRIKSSGGLEYLALRPTMSDVILKMPRSAQIIYPKDIGPILIAADIAAGNKVLESGIGSGALSIALLRAGASVTGIELREDFAKRARKNVESFFSDQNISERYEVLIGDAYNQLNGSDYDRIVLDLPEPWRVIDHVENTLRPGGILVSYSPSITQVSRLTDRLREDNFAMTKTQEILSRSWHVDGRAVRPDHRMVAHTGFITSTRYLGSQ
tara:strand:- start:16461 stop:17249 length:789 start_codon:yes stop_codon:yes gene_type:complete